MCAVSGCIVLLKYHIFWQISLGCWKSIWYVNDSTMMGKWQWPLVNARTKFISWYNFMPSWNTCFNVLSIWIFWLFVLHSSLFFWWVKSCIYVSLPVTMDSGISFHFSLDGCTCKESGLKMLIFLLFYQTSCGISVPHKQYYVHLWWTTATQWIHLCELMVSKIGACTYIALTSWRAEPTIAVIIIMSQHFMTCCIVIMPSPYTFINWPLILMGDMRLPKTNWITLWTLQDHVPHSVAIAHNIFHK